jgi:hypothetical protein
MLSSNVGLGIEVTVPFRFSAPKPRIVLSPIHVTYTAHLTVLNVVSLAILVKVQQLLLLPHSLALDWEHRLIFGSFV